MKQFLNTDGNNVVSTQYYGILIMPVNFTAKPVNVIFVFNVCISLY